MLITFVPDQDGFMKHVYMNVGSVCLPSNPLALAPLLLFLHSAHHPQEIFYCINSVLMLVLLHPVNICLSGRAA